MTVDMTGLFTQIDHIGIAVPNLDEAIKQYETAFGMTMTHRETNEEQGVEEAMMAIGDSGSFIQLLAPIRDDSPIAKQLEKKGPGIAHMGYRVKDIDPVMEGLQAAGMKLLYPEPKTGTANSRINFIHPKSAGGVLVEIVQPGEGHH